jgi:flagellar motor switch protein FliG
MKINDCDSFYLSRNLIMEHPQTISLLISFLSFDRAGEVLIYLPEGLQAEVILRIACMGQLSGRKINGLEFVVEILKLIDKTSKRNVMNRVDEKNPELGQDIVNKIKGKGRSRLDFLVTPSRVDARAAGKAVRILNKQIDKYMRHNLV